MELHRPFLAALLLAVSTVVVAAPPPSPAILLAQPRRVLAAQLHQQERLSSLGFSSDHEGRLVRSETDLLGWTTSRFQQYYRGIPVWGAQWVVHQDALGNFRADDDRFQEVKDLSVIPALRPAEALATAVKAWVARGAHPFQPSPELVIVPVLQDVMSPAPQGGVLNARDVRVRVSGYELAYHVSLRAPSPEVGLLQHDFLVQAHTGRILREWDSLETSTPAKGKGLSQYSGTVTLDTTKQDDGTYVLLDPTRGTKPHPRTGRVGNATYNLDMKRPSTPYTPGDPYLDPDDQWGDGKNYDWTTTPPSTSDNGQTAAVDAHYGLQSTWDTYVNVFHRNGIDGQGTSTFNRVHFGNQYKNAFWDTDAFCMNYGDGGLKSGLDKAMRVFTELDVTGHEMSHGVTAFSAGLNYYDEMGGLNESSSDIMGKMVEFYAYGAGGKGSAIPDTGGRWELGWGIDPSGQPLRWMYKPSLDGSSPDYWNPSLGYLNVHYSSGPNNRMFYFLSVGASPDPASVSFSSLLPKGMAGLGNQKAGQIWYRALTQYMTPDTRYFDARRACVKAAADLFGELSPEYQAVQNAYAGINVGIVADGRAEDFMPPVLQSLAVQGVTGFVTFSAQATDDRGLASADYFVDGFYAGTSTLPGFTVTFDSSTIPNGPHTLTATVYDTNQNPSAKSSVSTSFTVHNARFETLRNGGFEWGPDGWTAAPLPDPARFVKYPHSGAYSLEMGTKLDSASENYLPYHAALFQDLQLPTDCDTLSFSVWFLALPPDPFTKPPTDGVAHDRITIQLLDVSGTVLKALGSYSNLDDTPDLKNPVWLNQTADLSDLKGRPVRLQIEGSNDDKGYGTAFFLDDFKIQGSLKPKQADLDGDGVVDGYDLALLMSAYQPGKPAADPSRDLNGDGVVDDRDLDMLLAAFGK